MRSWIRRHGRLTGISLVLLLLLSALDLSRPPREQWTARGLLAAIHLYQSTLSPHLGEMGVRCRFTPTCSHYGEGAIRKYGALVGTARTAWRIARCGPWTPLGTYDPP
jgi:putative membrane protein insertion efficiency factor